MMTNRFDELEALLAGADFTDGGQHKAALARHLQGYRKTAGRSARRGRDKIHFRMRPLPRFAACCVACALMLGILLETGGLKAFAQWVSAWTGERSQYSSAWEYVLISEEEYAEKARRLREPYGYIEDDLLRAIAYNPHYERRPEVDFYAQKANEDLHGLLFDANGKPIDAYYRAFTAAESPLKFEGENYPLFWMPAKGAYLADGRPLGEIRVRRDPDTGEVLQFYPVPLLIPAGEPLSSQTEAEAFLGSAFKLPASLPGGYTHAELYSMDQTGQEFYDDSDAITLKMVETTYWNEDEPNKTLFIYVEKQQGQGKVYLEEVTEEPIIFVLHGVEVCKFGYQHPLNEKSYAYRWADGGMVYTASSTGLDEEETRALIAAILRSGR